MSWRTTERIEIQCVISKTVLGVWGGKGASINSLVVVWSIHKKPRKEKKETWSWTIGKHKKKIDGFIYTRHDHTFVSDFLDTSSPIVFLKDTPKIYRHRKAESTRMKKLNQARVPGWLSPRCTGLMISATWVQAPHWVWSLLKNKPLKKKKSQTRQRELV